MTSIKRVLISVEGQTEEGFIKETLSTYLVDKGIYLTPVLVTTKRVISGKNFKGGLVSYEKLRRDILTLLRDSNLVAVTTMYDLYGLPDTFPNYDTCPTTPYKKVKHLEEALTQDIGDRRFRPYLQLHEFETFLFVDLDTTATKLKFDEEQREKLKQIKDKFGNPEKINDSPDTAPSKRIKKIVNSYKKVIDGTIISQTVGLDKLRQECRHFNEWVTWLERL